MPQQKEDSYIAIARLKKLVEIIELLRMRSFTIKQLVAKFDIAQSTAYRYKKMLEATDLPLDQDFENGLFIFKGDEKKTENYLEDDEMAYFKKLVHSAPRTDMKYKMMKRLKVTTDDKDTTTIKVNAAAGAFIEKLQRAMDMRKQVVVLSYHSANSLQVSDRLLEPINFGDNYQTIVAFDVKDQKVKHFKIDRIGDLEIKRTFFKHEKFHHDVRTDVFGYTGSAIDCITLHLTLRAFVKLKEDYPGADAHITQEKENYIFKAPVFHYEGIAVFVLSMLNDVKIVESKAFLDYMLGRIKTNTLKG